MLVDTCAGDQVKEGLGQRLALNPRDNSDWGSEDCQCGYSKPYVISEPAVCQSKKSDPERDFAESDSGDRDREFGCTIIYHDVEMAQVH
jgi:hypothetical protein